MVRETLSNFLFKHRYQHTRDEVTHMDMLNKKKYHIFCCGMHVEGPQYDWREKWDLTNHEQNCDNCTFLNLYANYTRKNFNSILERTNEFAGPVIVDVDLKCEEQKPLYTQEQVLSLVRLFQDVITNNVVVPENKPEFLDCYVLEKPGYFKDGKFKNGFHLHFPHVWLSVNNRQKINDLVRKNNPCFELDDAIIRGNWFLYGSGKNTNAGVYKVSYIVEKTRSNVKCNKDFTELVWLLSVIPRWDTIVSKMVGDDDVCGENVLNLTCEKPNVIDASIDPLYSNYTGCTEEKPNKKKGYDELKHYVNQLSDFRSEDYMCWISIGNVLYNECNNKTEGKKLWHEFSKRCLEKYNPNVCDEFWDQRKKGKHGFGTLYYYIKQDNDGEFVKYRKAKSKIIENIDIIDEYILYKFPKIEQLTKDEREILVCTMQRPEFEKYAYIVKGKYNLFCYPDREIEYNEFLNTNLVRSKHSMKNVVEIFRKHVDKSIHKYTGHVKWNEKVLVGLLRSGKDQLLKSKRVVEPEDQELMDEINNDEVDSDYDSD